MGIDRGVFFFFYFGMFTIVSYSYLSHLLEFTLSGGNAARMELGWTLHCGHPRILQSLPEQKVLAIVTNESWSAKPVLMILSCLTGIS